MNGTVRPSWVVVVATSLGGFFGSYSAKLPLPLWTYWKSYSVGWLHCASVAPGSHGHGCSCGPEKTGPPLGWFVTTSLAPLPPGSRAISALRPRGRPLTRPSRAPAPRGANALVTSRPWAVIFSARTLAAGAVTRTSTSPAEIRSARLDSVLMWTAAGATAALDSATIRLAPAAASLAFMGSPPVGG